MWTTRSRIYNIVVMNIEFIVLRLLHIIPGVIWAGSAVILAFVLAPRMKRQGQGPALSAYTEIAQVGLRVMNITGGIAILFGILMAIRMRIGSFDAFINTGWGWAIILGVVMSTIAMSTTGMGGGVVERLRELAAGGSSASNEDVSQTTERLDRLLRITAITVLIALVSMASARFVG